MARSTLAVASAALANLQASLLSGSTPIRRPNVLAAVDSLAEVAAKLREAYIPNFVVSITDTTDATLAALFVSGEFLGVKGAKLEVGDVFRVNGSGDTTDNALAGAKDSAVAAGDLFEITNTGTPAVAYLGVASDLDISGIYLNRGAG